MSLTSVSSASLHSQVQHTFFLSTLRNNCCFHNQDNWIWLRLALNYLVPYLIETTFNIKHLRVYTLQNFIWPWRWRQNVPPKLRSKYIILFFFFLFFFHWHYSPLWDFACRTMSIHFFLSATNSLHLSYYTTHKPKQHNLSICFSLTNCISTSVAFALHLFDEFLDH